MTRKEAQKRLAATIRQWLESNKHDRHAEAVCRRLRQSEAAAAFATVRPDGSRWEVLLGDCIAAEERGREHKAITDKAKRTIAQAERYAGQIARIAQWVRAPIVLDGKNVVSGALDLVAEQIKSRLQNAERVLDERSRKADASGARAMAVGWIREAVLKSSGKPNLDAVKTLAEAALGIDGDEITIHAIRKTVTPSDALWLGYRNAKAGAHPDVLDTSRIAIWSEPARSKDKKPAE